MAVPGGSRPDTDATDPECQAWQRCKEDEEEGRRELSPQDQQKYIITDSFAELPKAPRLTSLEAHTSPFDTLALGCAQIPAESMNIVKDKAGHTGMPEPLRGQGDDRLSQEIKKKMKKCPHRATKVAMHSKCLD